MIDNKWDSRFLDLAKEVASWSKDPSCKVGVVIVNKNKIPLSMGYNGLPVYINDALLNDIDKDTKNTLVVHAEINALIHLNSKETHLTLYTTHQSCLKCAMHVAHATDNNNQRLIDRVVYNLKGSPSFCERHRTDLGNIYLENHGIVVEQMD